MTPREAARRLGVSVSTVYRRIKSGIIKAVKVGRRWRIQQEKNMSEWPKDVNRKYAEPDGREPGDFRYDHWPVTNVRLTHPEGLPGIVALAYHCDIPADTPQTNQYDADGNEIPDPTGMALSSVRFQMVDVADRSYDVLDEDDREHRDGKVLGLVPGNDPCELWRRLTPGKSLDVQVAAFPLFFYLNDDGGVQAAYAVGNQGYFRGRTSFSRTYTLSMDENGVISIDGEAAPDPEQVEVDTSEWDKLKAKEDAEEAERLKEQRATEDRLRREEKEREARFEREQAEREADYQRAVAMAAEERKANAKYMQKRERTKKELLLMHFDDHIKGNRNEDDEFLAVLRQATVQGEDWKAAAEEIAAERGWTL